MVMVYGKKQSVRYIDRSGANNIELLPLQPLEEASHVYSIGEVGIVIGRKGTSRNGFPSKTWSIMAAGQAMISCFDIDSEFSNFVREGNCGIAVPPDNSVALKNAILELYLNPTQTKEYGRNARSYVSSKFSRDAATSNIIHIVKRLIKKHK